jgi:PKD repeat protein
VLDQIRQHDQATGQRLLDVFSVHYYPQGGEFSDDTSSAMQLRRNRSTRSLWDPSYVDETWINDRVRLVRRLKEWVAAYYPGTKTAITEYNWGAEGHINGATTQADILGIFGREGLDMAARWTTPAASTPTYKAMKLYRNYDGQRSTFGDVSVRATAPNADNVSAFAAERQSDGALTILVVNKQLSSAVSATISLANFATSGTAERWQLTSSNQITRQPDVTTAGNQIAVSLPAQSITLFVCRRAATANLAPTAVVSATPTSGAAPLAVSFTGAASSDPDGAIASWSWAFGDGATATGPTATHTYAAGSYSATLTVTDDDGATASSSIAIAASGAASLAAPTNLTATALSNRRVSLGWTDNASNEEGFYVERAPRGSSAFTRVGQTGANAATYVETVPSGRYVYRVQAFNATSGQLSGYSNETQVRVKKRRAT